jgi:hypothetical protein
MVRKYDGEMRTYYGRFVRVGHVAPVYDTRWFVFELDNGEEKSFYDNWRVIYNLVRSLGIKKGDRVKVRMSPNGKWDVEKL